MCNAIGGGRGNVSRISNCSLLDDNRCIFNSSLKIERSSFQNKLHRRFGFHKGGGRGIHLIEWNKKRKRLTKNFIYPFSPSPSVFRRNKKDRGATRRIKERKINETLQITKNGNSSIMEWNEKLLYL